MIVVRVLLRPGGDPRAERVLGEVAVENLNGAVEVATYRCEAHDLTDDTRSVFTARHARARSFWELVAEALAGAAAFKRGAR